MVLGGSKNKTNNTPNRAYTRKDVVWSGWYDTGCGFNTGCGNGHTNVGSTGSGCAAGQRHTHCVDRAAAASNCPSIGTVAPGGNVLGDSNYDLGLALTCTYNSIKPELIWNDNELNKHFDTQTINRIQSDTCSDYDITQLSTNESNCTRAIGKNAYDSLLINKCEQRTDWHTNGPCLSAVTNSVQNNISGTSGKASTMIKKFCRGGDGNTTQGMGPGRNSKLCACLNASDFGFAPEPAKNRNSTCFDPDKINLPGCQDIVVKTGQIVTAKDVLPSTLTVVQAAISDVGNISSSCTVDAKSPCDSMNFGQCVLPAKSNAENSSINFNICQIISQQQISQDSPVSQACKINDGGSEDGEDKEDKENKDETFFSKNKWYVGGGVSFILLIILLSIILLI